MFNDVIFNFQKSGHDHIFPEGKALTIAHDTQHVAEAAWSESRFDWGDQTAVRLTTASITGNPDLHVESLVRKEALQNFTHSFSGCAQ